MCCLLGFLLFWLGAGMFLALVFPKCFFMVLAAGLSRRYGGNKLLEERVSEEPLYEVTLDKLSRFYVVKALPGS